MTVKGPSQCLSQPHAHLQRPDITVDEVLASRMLAAPLRLLDMCPSSDGACAVVMAAPDRAREMTPRPAWVAATETAHDTQFMGDSPKRLARMRSLIAASDSVYSKAGIVDPRAELDVAEVYEPASYAELAMYESLRFCDWGEGGSLIDDGVTHMDGELPVNPSGGVLSTNPVGATALIRVAEAALQVMGEAGGSSDSRGRDRPGHRLRGNAWTEAVILKGSAP